MTPPLPSVQHIVLLRLWQGWGLACREADGRLWMASDAWTTDDSPIETADVTPEDRDALVEAGMLDVYSRLDGLILYALTKKGCVYAKQWDPDTD